jgi:large-conductance mechanosensitive channel
MKDSIVNTKTFTEKKSEVKVIENKEINYWSWIALFEFVIILLLIFRLVKKTKQTGNNNSENKTIKEQILNEKIDFDNILFSSFNAKELHDKLIRKCHPDRFPNNPDLSKIADYLTREIRENRTNIKKLEELKLEAIEKLNINF